MTADRRFLPEAKEKTEQRSYAFPICRKQAIKKGKANQFHNLKLGDVVEVKLPDGKLYAGRYRRTHCRSYIEFKGQPDHYLPNDPSLKNVKIIVGEYNQKLLLE